MGLNLIDEFGGGSKVALTSVFHQFNCSLDKE